ALSTQSISHRIRELSRLAITDRLKEALEQEIGELDPIANRVELKASASKGKPAVQFKLRAEGREKVGKVLSTGEQTALATAFFLAELRVSNERSAIVLDDPISSLDHQRREHLAARLAEEARTRQVVVLTHDLVFVYYLLERAEELGLELHSQALTRAAGEVGVVSDNLPWEARSPMQRLKALRHELNHELRGLYKGRDSAYERRAQLWLLDLRKGYERLIEVYLLNSVVERQSLPIRVQKLHGIRWSPELAEEIDVAMREISGAAHQEPLGREGPTLTRLEALLDKFADLCERTKPVREGGEVPTAVEPGAPGSAPPDARGPVQVSDPPDPADRARRPGSRRRSVERSR
ncbi:MAG TPA: AAA family ATPase, partial [Solirubrobacterales bacterium]|nr:AAA family ATPase [Solirubrobacterales bacterium]